MGLNDPSVAPLPRYEVSPETHLVVSANGTAELVNRRLGQRHALNPQEHGVVSMIQAGTSLEEIEEGQSLPGELIRRLCERLVGIGLLRVRVLGRTFLPDDRPKVASGVKFTRTEKPGIVACTVPGTGRTYELRDMDATIAHSLDGSHTVLDIVEATRLRGVPATLATMSSFLRELDSMGVLERPPTQVMPRMDDVEIEIPVVPGPANTAEAPAPAWIPGPAGPGEPPVEPAIEQKLDALRSLSMPGEAKEPASPWPLPWMVTAVGVAALGAVLWKLDFFGPNESPHGTPAPIATRSRAIVTVVEDAPSGSPLMASGYVAARDPIVLGATLGGRVSEVFVESGHAVEKDQLLVQLDDSETRAELALAKAKKRDADRILERTKALHRSEAATQAELDRALGQAEIADAELGLHQQRVEQAKIRSPIANGTVMDVLVRPGEVITAGASTGVVKLADLSKLVGEIDVSEAEVYRLRVGQAAEISADTTTRFTGTIREIAEEADRARGTVLVTVDLQVPDRSLRPGNSVKASFPSESSRRVFVPRTSVRDGAVWVVDEGSVARSRRVTTRAAGPDVLEVLSGLQPGERIIAVAGDDIVAGMRIEE